MLPYKYKILKMNIYFTLPSETIAIIGQDLSGIKSDIDTVRLPLKAKNILHSVKKLIEQRFKVFEEKINEEEKVSGNKSYILMDFTFHPLEIKHIGYSQELVMKMKQSLTQDDLDYVEKFGNIK